MTKLKKTDDTEFRKVYNKVKAKHKLTYRQKQVLKFLIVFSGVIVLGSSLAIVVANY